jgi:cytidine deaminase
MRWTELDARERTLLQAARDARRNAYAPYSGFKVGAAVRTRDDRIFAGCNVENASLGAGICAERGAAMQAVAKGMRRGQVDAVAVYTTDTKPTPPCGVCLQFLAELGHDPVVYLGNARAIEKTSLRQLLRRPFTSFPRRSA